MYLPPSFSVPPEQTSELLREGGFAHLVTPAPDGIEVTSLPLIYDEDRHALVGHMARPNPHWKLTADVESVAVIPGPDAYVSPTFYPSKAENPRTVPTWNYEILHVFGRLIAHDDPGWLREQVVRLTDRHEGGRAAPWRVDDAPSAFVDAQLRAIVGVELAITRVVAKAKLSQNRSAADRSGVIRGLAAGTPADRELAARMTTAGLGAPAGSGDPPA
ncbi:FMN-binding negative transcriptional regulator [Cryptosporangium sp. NPDC051539]|uniref:FMN-binding negative transcriptional regulator n=1 Tax=Cryptosporangium sp. NPDC051539 TaxID=3363962 RepID=UPI0037B8EAE2